MYTYESFEEFGVFTLLRPILITFLLVSLMLFLIVLFPRAKNKLINGFTVISISVITILVSAQLLFFHGIIVDEINLAGDPVSFNMFLVIVGLSILNFIIYFVKHGEKKGNEI